MIYVESAICGCTPKPDEWSAQVIGACIDCGQKGNMIDYNLIMYIGLGLIIGVFCLFLYSEHKKRQLDIEEFKNQQLTKSFMKAKNDNRQFVVISNNGIYRYSSYLLVHIEFKLEPRSLMEFVDFQTTQNILQGSGVKWCIA